MHETLSVIIKVCRFYDASRVHPHQSESIKYTFMKYLKSRNLKYKIDHSFIMSEDQFKYIMHMPIYCMKCIIIYVLVLSLFYPSYSSFAFNYVIRDSVQGDIVS